jgi:GTPase
MSNIVAIVGRPNVGKSTLFNRLTETRKAITDEQAGVTRDRHYGKAEWNGKEYSVIDTGGYVMGSDDEFEGEIRKQVKLAIEEAQVILFVTDVTSGVTDLDLAVALMLRRCNKKVLVVVNKVDNNARLQEAAEFYSLGLSDTIYPLSSINGSGTGELLDELVAHLKKDTPPDQDLPKIAIVGQPNVGKSSLLNALTGEERTIVNPNAGTTRDTIYSRYTSFGFDFYLIDTAGLRRKKNVVEDIEFYSVMRTINAIEDCDVCLFLIDATQGLTAQDLNIFHVIQTNKKGVVFVANKWDLVEKGTNSTKHFTDYIRSKTNPFDDVPVICTSVTDKQRILKALEMAIEVYKNKTQHISTAQLNKIIIPYLDNNPPPATKGKMISIKYITQIKGSNPKFACFANHPQYIKETYSRFVENKLRQHFKLTGVPIDVYFRSSK